jgi:hypothetical protein
MSDMIVQQGDKVHILTYGAATVTAVLPDNGGCMVQKPGQSPMHFGPGGCLGASDRRLLFWHDPLLIEPPKDPALWSAFKGMASLLYGNLLEWKAGGWKPGA